MSSVFRRALRVLEYVGLVTSGCRGGNDIRSDVANGGR